ncbi:MAG TPA: hypothetical protein PK250_11495 [Syntrophobacter fumaroxidans]|nr:hypothetical protein [Syntrophobacter fumaroxidans]
MEIRAAEDKASLKEQQGSPDRYLDVRSMSAWRKNDHSEVECRSGL